MTEGVKNNQITFSCKKCQKTFTPLATPYLSKQCGDCINLTKRLYYERNKNKVVLCECGDEIKAHSMKTHIFSNKHKIKLELRKVYEKIETN